MRAVHAGYNPECTGGLIQDIRASLSGEFIAFIPEYLEYLLHTGAKISKVSLTTEGENISWRTASCYTRRLKFTHMNPNKPEARGQNGTRVILVTNTA